MKAGTEFEFALAARRPHFSAKNDLERGFDLLREALETLGSGGKTAVGYGRMVNARIENPNAPPEESVRDTVFQWSAENLAEKLGKGWNKTLKELLEKFPIDEAVLKKALKSAVKDRSDIDLEPEHWQDSDNKNQRKAYSHLFADNARVEPQEDTILST